jgi:hypothetical protein
MTRLACHCKPFEPGQPTFKGTRIMAWIVLEQLEDGLSWEEHVLSLFKEDVAAFLESNQIPVFPDFKLSGRSGFDHKFDFGLPKTQRKPQCVVQAINNLTKDQALSSAFAVSDVRAIRAEPLQAFTFLNDADNPPNQDNLAAIKAHDVQPLLWSRRHEAIPLLNGG